MLENLPSKVRIIEVGPRDGLQNEKTIVSIEDKFHYIKLLTEAGLHEIEATSFVRADKIPQMSDGKSLYQKISTTLDLNAQKMFCLVPNLKGMEEALSVGVKDIAVFTATSNTFTQKNTNATINESLKRIEEVSKLAQKNNVKIRGYISTVFGCPYEGKTSVNEFIRLAKILKEFGAYEISIGDTIGIANPLQVKDFLETVLKQFKSSDFAMHFHDTRGMALANILTSLEFGITSFDSSSAGLGGCPYAKGASGNVATEDLVNFFHSIGIDTGIEMDKLAMASRFILEKIKSDGQSKFLKAYLGEKNKGV